MMAVNPRLVQFAIAVSSLALWNLFSVTTVVTTRQQRDGIDSFYQLSTNIRTSSSWDQAIQAADAMIYDAMMSNVTASCFLPNTQGTLNLVEELLRKANQTKENNNNSNSTRGNVAAMRHLPPLVSLPVLNVGLPKCGSTTLLDFFRCSGFRATHWYMQNTTTFKEVDWEGLCMRDAVNIGLPPLETCAKGAEALLQMDVEIPFGTRLMKQHTRRDDCFMPQLSLLNELHSEAPDATFVLNFRSIVDWIQSVTNWGTMMHRFQKCHLPNLPYGMPRDLTNATDVKETMMRFTCSHVLHLRQFVKDHPSHALIELDLYDTNNSSYIMSQLFPTTKTRSCWGHSNKMPKPKSKPQGNQTAAVSKPQGNQTAAKSEPQGNQTVVAGSPVSANHTPSIIT